MSYTNSRINPFYLHTKSLARFDRYMYRNTIKNISILEGRSYIGSRYNFNIYSVNGSIYEKYDYDRFTLKNYTNIFKYGYTYRSSNLYIGAYSLPSLSTYFSSKDDYEEDEDDISDILEPFIKEYRNFSYLQKYIPGKSIVIFIMHLEDGY